MTPAVWVAGAGLVVTIFLAAAAVIWKLAENKIDILNTLATGKEIYLARINQNRTEIDKDLESMRTASFVEYKELRSEFAKAIQEAYLQLGEGPKSLREKVSIIEVWIRDNFVKQKDYDRDQDQILSSIRSLAETIDRRFDSFEKKLNQKEHV